MYAKFEELLRVKGVSTYKVSKATGIASATFTDWKKGTYEPKKEKIEKIAEYFDVPLSYFYETGEDETTSDEKQLLSLYRELNDEGKELLIDYAGMLQKKYTEDSPCEVSA